MKKSFDGRILQLKEQQKVLVEKVKKWIADHPSQKMKKSDPIYKDYCGYQQIPKDIEALLVEKKAKIEQVQKSAVLQAYSTTSGTQASTTGQA